VPAVPTSRSSRVEEVDRPDGNIGCTQPGMFDTRAIANGSRIVPRQDGADHADRQGGRRSVSSCPPGSDDATMPAPTNNLAV